MREIVSPDGGKVMLTTKLRIALSLALRQPQLIPHKMSNTPKKEEN